MIKLPIFMMLIIILVLFVIYNLDYNVPDDIDVVYTWYNSNDYSAFRTRMYYNINPYTEDKRFTDIGELKYSINSVKKYMPWVRKIWVAVADDQEVPQWLKNDTDVTVVRHSEFFHPNQVRPTYNSVAIESSLHRINGLSEKFIYFNDDTFIGKPMKPSHFYTRNGRPKVWLSPVDYHKIKSITNLSKHNIMEINAFNQVMDIRPNSTRKLKRMKHQVKALTKSMMKKFEESVNLESTRSSRFRDNLSINTILGASTLCLIDNECVERCIPSSLYVNLNTDYDVEKLRNKIKNVHLYCLNDSTPKDIQLLDSLK